MSVLIGGAPTATAIVDATRGSSLTYAELVERANERSGQLALGTGELAILRAAPTVSTVVDYLALRTSDSAVVMVDPQISADALAGLIAAYEPSLVLGPGGSMEGHARTGLDDHPVFRNPRSSPADWDEPISVLLPTSGSTGNPKLVQLTNANLDVNAADIASALSIDTDHRGLAPLPLFYSYGLSILNSHLLAGATTVLTDASPLRPEFWATVRSHEVTSIPGVPHSYEMFRRVGMLDMDLPSLRYLTQAGGKLATDQVLELHDRLAARNCSFFVMYGQTEASPRMSTLPSDDLPDHAGSVGFALEHGKFTIGDPDDNGAGEVCYDGPNVMVGYATQRSDLGKRTQHGSLATGDLGQMDDDGRLTITGRLKRIAKLFGTRVNLEDIESQLRRSRPLAAVEGKNRIDVFVEGELETLVDDAKAMERRLRVPPKTIRVHKIDGLPRNANGKIDYRSLSRAE